MKKLINIKKWDRMEQYIFFNKYDNPYYEVTSEINCDNIFKLSKQKKYSFYGLMIYLCLKSLNEIDEFKYFVEDKKVYKYDNICGSFSVLDYKYNLHFSEIIELTNLTEFMKIFDKYKYNAENNLKTKTKQINNVAYFTCFPWIKITSFKNAHNGIDYNSRICWGKYYKENNLYYINISIEVNHSIIDGYHIGKFFTILQKNIEELEVLL